MRDELSCNLADANEKIMKRTKANRANASDDAATARRMQSDRDFVFVYMTRHDTKDII